MLRVLVKSSLGPRHYLEKFQIPRASLVGELMGPI